MSRIPKKQRLVLLGVSTALAAGGALLPTSAFAAPATPHTGTATTMAVDQAKADPAGKGKKNEHDKKKGHNKKGGTKKGGNKKDRVKDIENMPGCVFHGGKVYCEHKQPTDKLPGPAVPKN
jgi:hypothetical protein